MSRGRTTCRRRAQGQWPCHGVGTRLQQGEPFSVEPVPPPDCGAREVALLAQHQFDAELIPKLAQPRSQRSYEPMRLHQGQVTE
jgi:hypothetical protein